MSAVDNLGDTSLEVLVVQCGPARAALASSLEDVRHMSKPPLWADQPANAGR